MKRDQDRIESVLRPAIRSRFKLLVDRRAAPARSDDTENFFGDGMGIGSAVPTDDLERLVRTVPGAAQGGFPCLVVAVAEAVKETRQGRLGAGRQPLREVRPEDLAATPLENRRGTNDLADDVASLLLGKCLPARDALTRLFALGGRRCRP